MWDEFIRQFLQGVFFYHGLIYPFSQPGRDGQKIQFSVDPHLLSTSAWSMQTCQVLRETCSFIPSLPDLWAFRHFLQIDLLWEYIQRLECRMSADYMLHIWLNSREKTRNNEMHRVCPQRAYRKSEKQGSKTVTHSAPLRQGVWASRKEFYPKHRASIWEPREGDGEENRLELARTSDSFPPHSANRDECWSPEGEAAASSRHLLLY